MSVTPDGTVKRVKIKSPTYVAMHHLKGRAIPKAQACATVLLTNEVDEYGNFDILWDNFSRISPALLPHFLALQYTTPRPPHDVLARTPAHSPHTP